MGAKGAQRPTGTKGARRKILSILHPNTILQPNLTLMPTPTLSLVLTLPLSLPLALSRRNIGTELVGEGISAMGLNKDAC